MIVSGEASGDAHAAKLVRAIRELAPAAEFFGAAGPRMREAGVEPVVVSDELSVVGLAEIGRALPVFMRAMRDLRSAAGERNPDVVILVDLPDFNLKLAKTLKKKGCKVVYYISPQIWAWRKYRISTIKKYVDLMLAILPFEKEWYSKNGVQNVEYVGSPLAREVHPNTGREDFRKKYELDLSDPVVALLPGSRHKEIVRILPVMLEAAAEMTVKYPNIQFLIASTDKKGTRDIESILTTLREEKKIVVPNLKTIENETYDVLNASDVAAVASGTATLETGIIGTPLAIVYKTSKINYLLLEPLIKVDHFGLINLIAESRLATELIQDEFKAETLSDELFRLLDPKVNSEMRIKLKQTADKLGHGGASARAAQAIMHLIEQHSN